MNSGSQNEKQSVQEKEQTTQKPKKAGPPVMVYKTKGDYFNNVPVTLSEDKKKVVAFPGIRDVKKGDGFSTPTLLENGYLLDNRGVDQNTAFLSLTYEEYAGLGQLPATTEMFEMILDADPFTELYNCGSRFDYNDLVPQINEIITTNKLETMERLK